MVSGSHFISCTESEYMDYIDILVDQLSCLNHSEWNHSEFKFFFTYGIKIWINACNKLGPWPKFKI